MDKMTEQQEARARREGFVEDYILVVDNDRDGYREALDTAREANGNVAVASEKFREQFEEAISQVVEREREEGNTLIAFLISQLLIGWGSDTFDSIARHYIDTDLEHRLVERLTSVLKTGN
jgi:hypothetical protein